MEIVRGDISQGRLATEHVHTLFPVPTAPSHCPVPTTRLPIALYGKKRFFFFFLKQAAVKGAPFNGVAFLFIFAQSDHLGERGQESVFIYGLPRAWHCQDLYKCFLTRSLQQFFVESSIIVVISLLFLPMSFPRPHSQQKKQGQEERQAAQGGSGSNRFTHRESMRP